MGFQSPIAVSKRISGHGELFGEVEVNQARECSVDVVGDIQEATVKHTETEEELLVCKETHPLLEKNSSSRSITIDLETPLHLHKASIGSSKNSMFVTLSALSAIAFLQFGSQVAYNSISALAPFLKIQNNFTSEDIAALYSAYHLPNLVMVLFGGILSDRIGAGIASVLFSSIVAVGTLIIYLGYPNIHVMIMGRFIFGIGSETLSVIQLSLCNRWFSKGFWLPLATSFALCDVVNRLGSIFAFVTLSYFAEVSVSTAFFVVLLSVAFSGGMSIVVYLIDRTFIDGSLVDEGTSLPSFKRLFRSISTFSSAFWILLCICITFYSSIVTFMDFSVDYFHENFSLDAHDAGKLTSTITIICLFLGPLAAFTADHMGYRLIFIFIGISCLLPAHFLFLFPSILKGTLSPLVPCLFLGMSLTFVAASLWCSLAIVIPSWAMSSGMGLATSLQNAGLFVFPLVVGYIRDTTGRYRPTIIVFIVLDVLALLAISILIVFRKQIPGARILRRPTTLAMESKTVQIVA